MRTLVCLALAALLLAQRQQESPSELTVILGRPTNSSIVASVLSPKDLVATLEYGTKPGEYSKKSKPVSIKADTPVEIPIESLRANTRYYYRLGAQMGTFHTQRSSGSTFSFGVQGDSHPERLNRMYDPALYRRTMATVRRDQPDFYITLGDDFNVDQLHNRNELNPTTVAAIYANQRSFLGLGGAPLFLVNGNHEQAAKHLLDGTPNSVPVIVGKARNTYFPLPAPDRFFTGDAEPVEHLGLRRDYYAWTWGDALFVTIDPYWHSPVQIDAGIGGGAARRNGERKNAGRPDGWAATMGDTQYQWLRTTLAQSKAKFKFVFAHHVLGTGRGAIEMADLYEWGGRNRNGAWEFDTKRPNWEMPVHQLFVKHGVTIFFQGHDHLFARQKKDGVTYQEVPNPADSTYTAFNKDAYLSGDILPNSGYLRITVSPTSARVDYIRSWLDKESEVAFSYQLPAK